MGRNETLEIRDYLVCSEAARTLVVMLVVCFRSGDFFFLRGQGPSEYIYLSICTGLFGSGFGTWREGPRVGEGVRYRHLYPHCRSDSLTVE